MGDEVAEILPNLLPEAEYIGEENIEVDRTTLRADLVYDIIYSRLPHILNMELQTQGDSDMPIRMAQYHIALLAKHNKPVISMILYPFKTTIPEPPFREMSGDKTLLMMDYKVVLLWQMEALPFLQDHIVCMYTLLPAMKGVTASMLLQALGEMKQHYSKSKFGDHVARFQKILRRSTTISEQDRKTVEATLSIYEYDSLMDDSPVAQRNLLRGSQQGARQMVLKVVEAKFPALQTLAEQLVTQINSVEALGILVTQVAKAPDEDIARWLLTNFTAQ